MKKMTASYGLSSREKVISAWPFLSSAGTTTYETQLHQDGILTCNCPGWVRHVANGMRGCKHVKEVLHKAQEIMDGRREPEFVKSGGGLSQPKVVNKYITVEKIVEKIVEVPRKEVEEIRSGKRLLRAIPSSDE